MFTFLFLISHAVAAQSLHLKVESAKYNYSLSIEKNHFEFSSNTKKVSRVIKPCGAPAYQKFAQKIERELQAEVTKSSQKSKNSVEAILNREKYYLFPLSSAGIYLGRLETEVDYVTSEDIYRCSKK